MQTLMAELERQIGALAPVRRLIVAFSGGADSTLLLHLAARTAFAREGRLLAVHCHHGLHPNADAWAEHCARFAEARAIPFSCARLQVEAAGAGTEAAARTARYRCFETLLEAGDLLLLGHHRDDQAETLLYRLLRGCGVDGAAAMPASRPLGRGRLLRPLLHLDRREIRALARQAGLAWLEDPSNASEQFDRNFLRHRVLPQLAERWPNAAAQLAAFARRAAETSELLDEYSSEDLARARGRWGLRLALMADWSEARALRLIRYRLRQAGLAMPDERRLREFWRQLEAAQPDRAPELELGDWRLTRFDGELCLHRKLPPLGVEPVVLRWQPGSRLRLASGTLRLEPDPDGLVLPAGAELRVCGRGGGERIRMGGHERVVKKLLQAAGIPPWIRAGLPFLWYGDRLVAVGDLLRADQPAEGTAGIALAVRWQPD